MKVLVFLALSIEIDFPSLWRFIWFYSNLNKKVIQNCAFSIFWQNLGFAGGFYSVQFLIKKELQIVISN